MASNSNQRRESFMKSIKVDSATQKKVNEAAKNHQKAQISSNNASGSSSGSAGEQRERGNERGRGRER